MISECGSPASTQPALPLTTSCTTLTHGSPPTPLSRFRLSMKRASNTESKFGLM
jgi:hypothetical protein